MYELSSDQSIQYTSDEQMQIRQHQETFIHQPYYKQNRMDRQKYNSKINKYYKLYDVNQFKNDSLNQSDFYQIDQSQFKSKQYLQLIKYLQTPIELEITQINNILRSLKYKFICQQKHHQRKIQEKIFINPDLTEIVIFIQYRINLLCKPLELSGLENVIRKKIISDKIFRCLKPVCIVCKNIKSRFCEQMNCQQQKVFCMGCEEVQHKHFFHKNSRIKYKKIDQIFIRINQLKLEQVQSQKLLSGWKQMLQQFRLSYAYNITIKMFMHQQGIYFFEYSSPTVSQTNKFKLIQAIYRSEVLESTFFKHDFIQFIQESSPKKQFPEKFHTHITCRFKQPYFILSKDKYSIFSRVKKLDSLKQLLDSNLDPDVMIGTKTIKMIDKRYLQALFSSKSSTGIVIKTTLKGNHCLVFTIDKNLVMEDEITDILWDDANENKIVYFNKLFAYNNTNANQFEEPLLQLTII